jgi:hypothetical protein
VIGVAPFFPGSETLEPAGRRFPQRFGEILERETFPIDLGSILALRFG